MWPEPLLWWVQLPCSNKVPASIRAIFLQFAHTWVVCSGISSFSQSKNLIIRLIKDQDSIMSILAVTTNEAYTQTKTYQPETPSDHLDPGRVQLVSSEVGQGGDEGCAANPEMGSGHKEAGFLHPPPWSSILVSLGAVHQWLDHHPWLQHPHHICGRDTRWCWSAMMTRHHTERRSKCWWPHAVTTIRP